MALSLWCEFGSCYSREGMAPETLFPMTFGKKRRSLQLKLASNLNLNFRHCGSDAYSRIVC